MVKVIVEANLLEEKLDDLLDLAFECYYRKTYKYSEMPLNVRDALYKRFKESKKYEILKESEPYIYVEKA